MSKSNSRSRDCCTCESTLRSLGSVRVTVADCKALARIRLRTDVRESEETPLPRLLYWLRLRPGSPRRLNNSLQVGIFGLELKQTPRPRSIGYEGCWVPWPFARVNDRN